MAQHEPPDPNMGKEPPDRNMETSTPNNSRRRAHDSTGSYGSPQVSPPRKRTASTRNNNTNINRTVFITSTNENKKLYNYCIKPNVNVEYILSQMLHDKPEITLNKRNDYIKVTTNTVEQKEKLLKINKLAQFEVKVTEPYSVTGVPPTRKARSMGVNPAPKFKVIIRGLRPEHSPEDFEDENILENPKLIPTRDQKGQIAIISYKTQEIPDTVRVCNELFETEGYIPRPVRCDKCQLFGHHITKCGARWFTCSYCGENHKYENCLRKAGNQPPTCHNCGGEHSAAFRGCPSYIKTQKILRVRAEQKITYGEARQVVRKQQFRDAPPPEKSAWETGRLFQQQYGRQNQTYGRLLQTSTAPETPQPSRDAHFAVYQQVAPPNADGDLRREIEKLRHENSLLRQERAQLVNRVDLLEQTLEEIKGAHDRVKLLGDLMAVMSSQIPGERGEVLRTRLHHAGYSAAGLASIKPAPDTLHPQAPFINPRLQPRIPQANNVPAASTTLASRVQQPPLGSRRAAPQPGKGRGTS